MYGAAQAQVSYFLYEQATVEIVHGPSCKQENEIHLEQCTADNVPIHERRSGGGTVVLAPGMLIIVITGPKYGIENPLHIFKLIHRALLTIFQKNGIQNISEKGISDLAIHGKKILGSSMYMGRMPANFYYQASLLVDADLHLMDCYLKHPPKEPEYRDGRDHLAFCTTLHQQGYRNTAFEIMQWLEQDLYKELKRSFASELNRLT
jgi:lipoate-protein ligase A